MRYLKNISEKINEVYLFRGKCLLCEKEFYCTRSNTIYCSEEHRKLYHRMKNSNLIVLESADKKSGLNENTKELTYSPNNSISGNISNTDIQTTPISANIDVSANLEIESLKYELLKRNESLNSEMKKYSEYNTQYELDQKISQMFRNMSYNDGRIKKDLLSQLFPEIYLEKYIVIHGHKLKRVYMNSEFYQLDL